MINNILPLEATHSSLDLFERAALLVAFDRGVEQRYGPVASPNGPTLEFKLVGERFNFIDLQHIEIEVKCVLLKANGTDKLDYDAADATKTDNPVFVNNALHSMFSECDVTANGIKISSSNGLYAHKAFLETEISHTTAAKTTWLACQGYRYESNPGLVDHADIRNHSVATQNSQTVTFVGKLAVDLFSCPQLLLPNVNLVVRLIRARNDFVILSDKDGSHYTIHISEANLYVRKMAVTEDMYVSIEKTLLKSPAMYKYTETLPKTFIIPSGQNSWRQEDVFMREPIRRFALAMSTNTAFGGHHRQNPFHYQKFGLRRITISRNGSPIAGTPIDTSNNNKLYLNSLSALAFTGSESNGIPPGDFANHFVPVFDLTSTLEASHDFIHPELTNASVSIELQFDTALTHAIEVFIIGEKASTLYIDSARNVSKNVVLGS